MIYDLFTCKFLVCNDRCSASVAYPFPFSRAPVSVQHTAYGKNQKSKHTVRQETRQFFPLNETNAQACLKKLGTFNLNY
jgi:hypothetical protein